MRAIEAASLLERLARGGELELSPHESVLLDSLVAAGLVVEAPDTRDERARLTALKDELTAIARAKGSAPPGEATTERERALRTQILDLSELVARGDGAARIATSVAAGPYRGTFGGEARSVTLTQRGRALGSNLGPRASRASGLSLEEFELHMDALRKLFAWRAGRAMTIANRIGARISGLEPSAVRTVAVGLSGVRQPDEALGDAFVVLHSALRHRGMSGPQFTAAQDASAAECLLLTAGDPQALAYDARTAEWFVDLRARLLSAYCAGRLEDALDSALLLAAVPAEQHEARIAACAALATELLRHSVPIPLSLALLATASAPSPSTIHGLVGTYRTLAPDTREPLEALAAAALVVSSGGSLETQQERLRHAREYLQRFAPGGMTVAAALLTLLESETPALLDDLRLASAEVQRYRLAAGGAEAMMHAIKLLVQSALLAHGTEGDPEEGIALVARALPTAAPLGLAGAAATLPMVLSAVTAFHRPMLDAALIYEAAYQPTHSDYVFGSGYGGSSSGSHHGYRHHRSVGWG